MTEETASRERPYVSDIVFSPAVKAAQARLGSRAGYARMERARAGSRG